MSYNTYATFGVGLDEDDISYENLTAFGKNIVEDAFKESGRYEELYEEYNLEALDEDDYEEISDEYLNDALILFFEDEKSDILVEGFDLDNLDSHCHLNDSVTYGVKVPVAGTKIDNLKQNVEQAIKKFKNVIDLEPSLTLGTVTY